MSRFRNSDQFGCRDAGHVCRQRRVIGACWEFRHRRRNFSRGVCRLCYMRGRCPKRSRFPISKYCLAPPTGCSMKALSLSLTSTSLVPEELLARFITWSTRPRFMVSPSESLSENVTWSCRWLALKRRVLAAVVAQGSHVSSHQHR